MNHDMSNDKEQPRVWRITVDERMSDDWVRLLVTRLAPGKSIFTDSYDDWDPDEDEVNASDKDFLARMHGQPGDSVTWASLQEGQVYLAGEFVVVGKPPQAFEVAPGTHRFERIDHYPLVKNQTKDLYARLVDDQDGVRLA